MAVSRNNSRPALTVIAGFGFEALYTLGRTSDVDPDDAASDDVCPELGLILSQAPRME